MKKYKIILKDNKELTVSILNKPLYPRLVPNEGNIKYYTQKEIKDNNYKLIEDDPHYLFLAYIGAIRDEGVLFNVYKKLRNPIVKLELIEN